MDESERILATVFPDRTVESTEPGGVSWNPTTQTIRVTFADAKPVYLKHAGPTDRDRIARECGTLRYVRDDSRVQVPTLVAADPDAEHPYLVTRPLAGRGFDPVWNEADGDDREELTRRLGATIAHLHESCAPTHGWLTTADRAETPRSLPTAVEDHSPDGESASGDERDAASRRSTVGQPVIDDTPWPELLIETIREHQRISPTDRFDDAAERLVTTIRDHRDQLVDVPASVCHGDPAGPNFFVPPPGDQPTASDQPTTGNRTTAADPNSSVAAEAPEPLATLDLEMAHAGDPVRDLYRARDQTLAVPPNDAPERLVTALHDGYRAVAGSLPDGFERRVPLYAAERLVDDAGFADKLAEWIDMPQSEFDDWIRGEIDDALDRVEERLARDD